MAMTEYSMDKNDPATYGMNLPTAMVIASFTTIAWFNTIELQFRIWFGFKRYAGLYFWSLLLSSWGCAIHPLGFLLLNFWILKNAHADGVIIGVSWWCMVTGQALVLYSRLHLVVRDKRKIHWVLIMIITNFCILHIPIMILSQVAYSPVPNASRWMRAYKIYEKVQMTGFTIQETIISGLYLWETRKILQPRQTFQKKKTRKVMYHLIWVNVLIICLDIALLSTEYANLFTIQTVFKAAIYSVKLRFEFVVLNQLLDLVQGHPSTNDYTSFSSDTYGNHHHHSRHSRNNTARSMPLELTSATARSHHDRNLSNLDPDKECNTTTIITGSNGNPAPQIGKPKNINGETYSAFATKGAPFSPHSDARDFIDGVLRTTEVHIVHGDLESPQEVEDALETGRRRTLDGGLHDGGKHRRERLDMEKAHEGEMTRDEGGEEGGEEDVEVEDGRGGRRRREIDGGGGGGAIIGGSPTSSEVEFAGKGA